MLVKRRLFLDFGQDRLADVSGRNNETLLYAKTFSRVVANSREAKSAPPNPANAISTLSRQLEAWPCTPPHSHSRPLVCHTVSCPSKILCTEASLLSRERHSTRNSTSAAVVTQRPHCLTVVLSLLSVTISPCNRSRSTKHFTKSSEPLSPLATRDKRVSLPRHVQHRLPRPGDRDR